MMCERTQITRDHPDYNAVTAILRSQPDLVVLDPAFIRVPDERAWLVRPGRWTLTDVHASSTGMPSSNLHDAQCGSTDV